MMCHDERNALEGEEAEEGPHNLQKVWQAQLSCPRQGMLSLRVWKVLENPQVRMAVEDCRGQEKEVGDWGFDSVR